MKKKILFVATVDGHIKSFHIPYLKWFKDNGYETHVASNGNLCLDFVDKKWQIDFERSPFKRKNFLAFRQIKKIITENDFSLVTCHTPMASVITRLASVKARKKGMKLLYTAHGFHFFKGASVFKWALYFPIEIFLTQLTDAVITINEEDFRRIKKYGNQSCEYFKIPGIGVNSRKFYTLPKKVRNGKRKDLGFGENTLVFIYAAELSKRKNHEFIIRAISKNKETFENTIVLFAGRGEYEHYLKRMVKEFSLEKVVHFLGFRTDIEVLFQVADIGLSSSKQEGLPINTLEEMFTGLPILVSDERGHRELVNNGINGFLFSLKSDRDFVEKASILINDSSLRESMGKEASIIANNFELNICLKQMADIFNKFLGDTN
ncbi:glycosyltransferase family 4 protein [Sphingobacterium sp. MYb382]|uniref:glycosyltransferase family 4 protein n=1 Tax=Sphingobacterium sp. MYb382 TaxID=2745278 RepID=UPI0030976AA4